MSYLKDSLRQHHDADCGTGLGVAATFISRLRQEIVDSKAFPFTDGSDPAGKVHFLIHHVAPESLNGRKIQ